MDDPFEDDAPKAEQPPKKKTLFSAKAKAIAAQESKADEIFSRSKEILPQILADEERRRKKKLMKLERKRSSTSADTKEVTPEEKRRRLSTQAKTQADYPSDDSRSPQIEVGSRDRRQSSHSTPGSQHSRKGSNLQKTHNSPTSLSARYNKGINSGRHISPGAVRSTGCITLSDSEDENHTKALPSRNPALQPIRLSDSDDDVVPRHRRPTEAIVEEENQFSDEEYPELVAAAKERARLKAEEATKAAKAFQGQNHAQTTEDLDDIFALRSGSADSDPIVEILITSMIEGTTALRVKRRISQNLAPVRIAWCKKQVTDGHPRGHEFKDVVFLTWKHIRLFDVTTGAGLGLKVNEMGSLASTGDGLGEDGRVHLEAWTPDSFEVFQKRQAAKEKKAQEQEAGDEVEYQQPAVPKTRLIFKSRDLPDFKLMVKPSTTVERMVEAFREGSRVSDDKTITMYFDGDKLDYSDKVEDTELGDLDTVEVHIK